MKVTFCGHRQVHDGEAVGQWLRGVTEDLIRQGAVTFYLGGMGAFDQLAARVLREQKARYPGIELVLVLAYLNGKGDISGYDATVYPPLEGVPPRYAIVRRNRWMVQSADVVVGYVLHDWGGAAGTLKYARSQKKVIRAFVPAVGGDAAPG